MFKIVSLSGKAGSGKDTIAIALQAAVPNVYRHGWFAASLKEAASVYYGWDGSKDQKGRRFLQLLGTDVGRLFDKDVWLASFVWRYDLTPIYQFVNSESSLASRIAVLARIMSNEESNESKLADFFMVTYLGWDGKKTDLYQDSRGALLAAVEEFNPCFLISDDALEEIYLQAAETQLSQNIYYNNHRTITTEMRPPESPPLPVLIVTDTRFENEIALVRTLGGLDAVVVRRAKTSGTIETENQNHVSENALSHHRFALTIKNEGSLADIHHVALGLHAFVRGRVTA